MILLTGVTGRIGGAAANVLAADGVPFRALVRDPNKAEHLNQPTVEVVGADLERMSEVQNALDGVSKVLLVTPNSEKQAMLERQFADAAASAGVQHIVKISSMEAAADARAPIPKLHFESEQYIQSLDLDWTMLRPNFFMQNLLLYSASIKNAGQFSLPLGTARAAPIDARDVGAVVATVLRGNGHENRIYKLAGNELLTFADVASQMTAALGKEVRYVNQSPEEFRAFLEQFIPSQWHVDAITALFAEIANGALDEMSPSVHEILGRNPLTLSQFTQHFRGAFL